MKTKYYLHGTVLGLCLIPAVAGYLLGPKELVRVIPEPKIFQPLLFGYISALVAGILADRWFVARGFFATVFILVGVYLAGAFFGCVANVFINGQVIRPPFGLREELWDYFTKPAFWFTVIGAPCAVGVGIIHYLAHRLYGRWCG
jgi:hypothetical protein